MNHSIQCICGAVQGSLLGSASINRCVCYCRSCQAFARFLQREKETLDEQGGSDIIQTQTANLSFSRGIENLACMQLSSKGILRWYSSCCRTPIGNTLHSAKFSFVGLIHTCFELAGPELEEAIGPVQMRVNTQSAKGHPKPKASGLVLGLPRVFLGILKARLNGSYRKNPFFDLRNDTPICQPRILLPEELDDLLNG